MAQIVLITNAWGPKHGGINSFNTDFAKALSPVLAPHTRVTCVVMDATAEEVEDAAKAGVRLLRLGVKGSERVDESRAANVLDAVQRAGTDEVLWWVGHDVISGSAAVALPKLAGQGKSAVIHHMSYVDYTAYKQGSATAAMQKRDQQQQLFRRADEVFAVGPLLRDSLTDLLQGSREVRMLVPGLAEIEPSPSPKTFSAITFGRLDPENDRIKQGRLAIAGFATACREAHANTLYPKVLRDNPRLLVFGVLPSSSEEGELRALASSKAGRVLNLLPLPYEEDRARLFEELKRSSIAMMLSWHEGFGLTGWEAIAAEVPLIVSRNSGLYKLIEEKLDAPGTACLRVVDVRGGLGDLGNEDTENFHAEDENGVGQAILELANEIERWKRRAKQLRTLLSAGSDGYTWPNTARSFAEALGLPNQSEVATNHPASYQPTASSAIVPPVAPGGATAPTEQSLLELRDPSWDRERGHAESHLLRPEEACVPFHGSRRQLLDEVLTWAMATDGLPAELQFRVGPAGSGKTRLMLEVCRELRQRGWEAGFLASNLQQNLEKAFKDLLANKPKSLVVVDYAETRRREVVDVVRVAFTAPKEHRVRIVLLARDAGEWWDRLATDYPTLEQLLTGRAIRGPYRLPEVSIAEQGRETIFREALQAFARRLNKDPSSILPPDLSTPHFASVLFIHLAAMASLSGERPETATSLLEATLRRERRYWHEAARAQGLPDSLIDGVDQGVGIITLRSGVKDTTEARRVLQSAPRLRGASPNEIDQVLTVLRTFYRLAGGVDALRPDILGERLVSQELAKDDALLDMALGRSADETTSRSSLTVLNRLARQSRSDVIWLQRGLQKHLPLRAEAAVTVAIESGDPIGKVLAEILEQAPENETWTLGEELRSKIPPDTIALRECALVLAQIRVRHLEGKGKPSTWKRKDNLARAYLDLGNRLNALGEDQESLAAYERALPVFQDLAKSDSKRLRDVSGCLSNISLQLSELGRDAEALQSQQESVKTARSLVTIHQDDLSYKVLAFALNGLSMHLRQNARLKEAYQSAEEALEIYHALEKKKSMQFRQEVARVVANIATTSWELGRDEDALRHAQEVHKIWQELAEKSPDAFQSLFASSLIWLTGFWFEAGQYKQAKNASERAVEIMRELVAFRPVAFGQEFGRALSVLAHILRRLGHTQEALKFAGESLKAFEACLHAGSAIAPINLADQHIGVSTVLTELGRYDDALRHTYECLKTYNNTIRAKEKINSYQSGYITASSHLAYVLVMTGRPTEALAPMQTARPLLDSLPQNQSARSLVLVRAGFWSMLAFVQFRLGKIDEAIGNSRSATELFEESLRSRPLVGRTEASATWCTRSSCEATLGDVDSSQRSAARGLELLQADLAEVPRQLSARMQEVACDLIRLAGPLASPSSHSLVYEAISRAPEAKAS